MKHKNALKSLKKLKSLKRKHNLNMNTINVMKTQTLNMDAPVFQEFDRSEMMSGDNDSKRYTDDKSTSIQLDGLTSNRIDMFGPTSNRLLNESNLNNNYNNKR